MGAMRMVFAVLAAQTALILFLSFHVVSIEARIDNLAENAAISGAGAPSRTRNDAAGERLMATPAPVSEGASPDEIREIVRNEMDALAWRILESEGAPRRAAKQPAPDPRDVAALNVAVASELNAYIASGRASPTEMQALQQKMARLPPGERERALGELTKAINDGRLDARF